MPTFKDNMKSMFGMLKKPETKESHSADADTKTKAIDPLNNKNSLITNSNINNSNSPMVKPTSSKKCELIAANVPIEKENADKKKTTQFAPKQIVNKSRDTIKNYDLYKYEYYSAQPIFDHLSPIFSNNVSFPILTSKWNLNLNFNFKLYVMIYFKISATHSYIFQILKEVYHLIDHFQVLGDDSYVLDVSDKTQKPNSIDYCINGRPSYIITF